MSLPNEPQTCDRCGIFYYEWLHGPGGLKAMFTPGAEMPEPMIPNMHVCPEPYPLETARYLLSFYANSGIPTTQTIKARIKLGLEAA